MEHDEAVATLESLPEVERIAVARLKPTDVIVIECREDVSEEIADRIKAYVTAIWPEHKCVVLDGGTTLKVVSE